MNESSGKSATGKSATRALRREVDVADLPALADFYGRMFPGRARSYWTRGFDRLASRENPDGRPRYGFALVADGRIVGALLTIHAASGAGPDAPIRSNLAGWAIDPAYAAQATMLSAAALKDKSVTCTNITATALTWPIMEAMGFKRLCGGLFVAAPFLTPRRTGTRIVTVRGLADAPAGLASGEAELLARHAAWGCLCFAGVDGDGAARPFVFRRLRIRRGRVPTPVALAIHARDPRDFVDFAGALARPLALAGAPLMALDADGPIADLRGFFTAKRGRKYAKGPAIPRRGDHADSELAIFGT
ncbi:MAG: acyl-CoA acyltransferase [Hyphomicrobiales bacterium]|nr:acyl-CoA acyltransferase [Hyphomicrobiales bacterium]